MSDVTTDRWTELVAEGREAVRAEEGAQWTLGRLAAEVAPLEKGGAFNTGELKRYAEGDRRCRTPDPLIPRED